MPPYSFALSFSQITCLGCGVNRIRGIECADCGRRPDPWEVDLAGAARRQAAQRARTLLSQATPVRVSVPMDSVELLHTDLFERLSTWIGEFFRGLAAAAGGSSHDLENSIIRLVEMRAVVLEADDRRPQRALIKVLRSLVRELECMVDAYLAALLASSPLQAQDLARSAQEHLDSATSLISKSSDVAAVIKMVAKQHDVAQLQAQLMDLALEVYGASDFIALDNAGRDVLQKLLSSRGAVGSGLVFALYDAWARNFIDVDRFRNVLRRAYLVFHSNPAVLRTLATDPLFEQDLSRAICELFDSSMEGSLVFENAVHSRQAGRALLGVASALVEGPGQVIATALLLACGRKFASYVNLRQKNATELVKTAQEEQALRGLIDGLDCELRTARAHALIHYEQDFAVVELKSSTRRVAWADVVDGVFQGQESVLACQIGLLHALAELGFSNFALAELWRSMGITTDQLAVLILKGMGCRDINIKLHGNRWQIEAHVGSATPVASLATLLLPAMPEEVEELSLTVHHDGGAHVLTGPVAPWRARSSVCPRPAVLDVRRAAVATLRLSSQVGSCPSLQCAE